MALTHGAQTTGGYGALERRGGHCSRAEQARGNGRITLTRADVIAGQLERRSACVRRFGPTVGRTSASS